MVVERRSFPRYPLTCRVAVTLPDDQQAGTFAGTCINLSRTSIQLECSAELGVALLRQPRPPYICQLAFALEVEEHPFTINATVVTQRRVSQHKYVLVLLLRHRDDSEEARLDAALSRQHPIGPH